MPAESRSARLVRWVLETGLAVMVAGAVYFLWPRVAVQRLGREEVWFALAWLVILAGPAMLDALRRREPRPLELRYTFEYGAVSYAAFVLGGLFVALLLAGGELGNYKLWLGVVYLGGVTLRLAGLSLLLRAEMLHRPRGDIALALAGAAIAALAALLTIPWLRTDLVALWPPPWPGLALPLAKAALWGAICGAVLLVLRLVGGSQRAAWLVFLALALGPGPALAVSWFEPLPLAVVLAVLVSLAVLRLAGPRGRGRSEPLEPLPMSLYWLLRALMLFWWGVGGAVALCAAWWQPRLEDLFTQSIWLRALGLGGFLVACMGLLAEYTLPLLGRPNWMGLGRERKLPGVILSALALLLAFSPLLLIIPYQSPSAGVRSLEEARHELLAGPVRLGPDNPELTLKPPAWLNGLSRVFVVSYIQGGAALRQGEPVVQLVAVDEQDLPHIFNLRAGIDTAERDLNKREVAAVARHGPARVARARIVYTPTGEAFSAQTYFTGLYLGRRVTLLKSVRLRYLYQNPQGEPPVTVELRQVFLN